MKPHVCPWWGGYFIDNRLRRLLHKPEAILSPYARPGMTAMDFGCGMGMFSLAMAQLVGEQGRVIAVDLQQQMLDVLRRRAVKASLSDRIDTHRCEANTIGLERPIDFALAFYSAHEVPEPDRLLSEMHSLLTPAGRFLIVEPRGHVSHQQFETMLALARDAGFAVEAEPEVRLSRAVVLGKTSQP